MEQYIELDVRGFTLRGMAHIPESAEDSKKPVVILFHGFTGTKIDNKFMFVQYARALAEQGLGCVRFDFSGSGESDGLFKDMTFSGEVEEGKAILQYVKGLDWVDASRVMITGFSMGGAVATQVAKAYPEDIHKLCLWAPAGTMNERAEMYARVCRTLPNGNFDLDGIELGREFYEDLKDRDLYEGVEVFTNPVCVIHGSGDETAPVSAGERYAEVYPHSELHKIDGADHTFSSIPWKEALIKRSIKFLL